MVKMNSIPFMNGVSIFPIAIRTLIPNPIDLIEFYPKIFSTLPFLLIISLQALKTKIFTYPLSYRPTSILLSQTGLQSIVAVHTH